MRPSVQRQFLVAAASCLTLVFAAGCGVAPASTRSDPPPVPAVEDPQPATEEPSPDGRPPGFSHEASEDEGRLLPLSEEIAEYVGDRDEWDPTLDDHGYLLERLDIDEGILHLYWKGELPEPVEVMLAKYPTVEVAIHAVPYARNEFLASQARIAESIEAELPAGEKAFMGVMHEDDRSGLIVMLGGDYTEVELATLRGKIDAWTTVPFRIKTFGANEKGEVPQGVAPLAAGA